MHEKSECGKASRFVYKRTGDRCRALIFATQRASKGQGSPEAGKLIFASSCLHFSHILDFANREHTVSHRRELISRASQRISKRKDFLAFLTCPSRLRNTFSAAVACFVCQTRHSRLKIIFWKLFLGDSPQKIHGTAELPSSSYACTAV